MKHIKKFSINEDITSHIKSDIKSDTNRISEIIDNIEELSNYNDSISADTMWNNLAEINDLIDQLKSLYVGYNFTG